MATRIGDKENKKKWWQGPYKEIVFLLAVWLFGLTASMGSADDRWRKLAWVLTFAAMAAGVVMGFLFGIPRSPQSETGVVSGGTAATNGGATRSSAPRPNTNLEQVSDWLSKIVVGVTLTQLIKIPDYMRRMGEWLSQGIKDAPVSDQRAAAGFFIGVVVLNGVLWFLVGFLGARLYLGSAFARADRETEDAAAESAPRVPVLADNTGLASPEGEALNADERAAIEQLQGASMEEFKTARQLAAWANAQLLAQNYKASVDGYEKSLRLDAGDPAVWHEYSVALYKANLASPNAHALAITQLLTAREKIDDSKLGDADYRDIKRCIYVDITYHYLYVQGGFEDAIKHGTEYVANSNNKESASVWVNLACAYAQKYVVQRDAKQDGAESRSNALAAAKRALSIRPGEVVLLRTLTTKDMVKDRDMRDLEVFEDDKEFRELLKL